MYTLYILCIYHKLIQGISPHNHLQYPVFSVVFSPSFPDKPTVTNRSPRSPSHLSRPSDLAAVLSMINELQDHMKNTLQGINISHLGKRKIIFKMPFLGDMLVSWRVFLWMMDVIGFPNRCKVYTYTININLKTSNICLYNISYIDLFNCLLQNKNIFKCLT